MARNGSGTYSTVNTFVAGTAITAATHNANWTDIASEMTNSVAVDGQSTMTGPLKASSGTAAAPSHTFGSDVDTGAYRIGANNYGISAGGTKIVDVATTGMTVTGDVDATTVKQGTYALLPPGCIFPYGGSSAPSGYLLCYGQAVSRTTYAALFTAISTGYGVGDGSTTFNLPDLRGRLPAGKDDMGGSAASRLTTAGSSVDGATLGAAGGAQSVTLAQANLPNVSPAITVTDSHQHPFTWTTQNIQNGTGSIVSPLIGIQTSGGTTTVRTEVADTGSITASIASINGGVAQTAVNNMPPAIVCNYIIKT